VQGVGFRYHAAARARELGINGWVRNCPDGRVEAELEGPEAEVAEMLAWCRRGPITSRVRGVTIATDESREVPRHTLFSIRS